MRRVREAEEMVKMKSSGALIILFLLLTTSAYSAAPRNVIESDIRSDDGGFIELFAGQKFYAGQKVTLVIDGQVDVNHEYFEERKCNWLGLNCWYEQRDRPHPYAPDSYPALISLRSSSGLLVLQPKLQVNASLSTSNEGFIELGARTNPQRLTFEIDIDKSSADPSLFGSGLSIVGKMADLGPRGFMNRSACVSRSPCSSGTFRVSVSDIDNVTRLRLLKAMLAKKWNADDIIKSLDRNLVQDEGMKESIAVLLFDHANAHHGGAVNPSGDYLMLLEYAANIAPNAASGAIGVALSGAYLKVGNVSLAKVQANKDHPRLAKDFEDHPDDPKVRRSYAENLRVLGQVSVRERSGIYSTDLIRATALFLESSKVAGEGAGQPKWDKTTRRDLYIISYEALVDSARALMMLRTPENMAKAEDVMNRAIAQATAAADFK